MVRPRVTVVVPVLEDVARLAELLITFPRGDGVSLVVVNGGPESDAWARLRAEHPWVEWRSSPPGRGRQMNAGADGAKADWLLFLHADVRLPSEWHDEVAAAAGQAGVVAGCFRFSLDSQRLRARWLERLVGWRVRILGLPYGDQALFVRTATFRAMGGYRAWPLMEDVDLVRRLRRYGRLWCSGRPVLVSARRWERDGWARRSAGNLLLLSLFFLGVPPDWLARVYYRRRFEG